jgi:putative transposase
LELKGKTNYRDLFKTHVGTELLKEIRESINKGLALGNERFTSQLEELTNQRAWLENQGGQENKILMKLKYYSEPKK